IGARAAAADPQSAALPDLPVIGRADCHRALRRVVAQHFRPPLLSFPAKPFRHSLDYALARDSRREEAAVEEDRVRTCRSGKWGGGSGKGGRPSASSLPSPFPTPHSQLPTPHSSSGKRPDAS